MIRSSRAIRIETVRPELVEGCIQSSSRMSMIRIFMATLLAFRAPSDRLRANGFFGGRFRRSMATALAVGLLSCNAIASSHITPPPQSKPLLITNATLHTVSGESIANGRMLIEKGKITRIGSSTSINAPADATIVDLTGKHVYPGLVAAYTTLGLAEISSVRATVDTTETGPLNPNARAVVAINADSELLPVSRSNGVLTALSAPRGSAMTIVSGTSAFIQLDGWNWEEMALVPELGLHVALPNLRALEEFMPNLPQARAEEMQRMISQRMKMVEDAFETAQAYAKQRTADPSLTVDSRWEAMRPIFATGSAQRKVFVEANDLGQIQYALRLAERFGLSVVIVGGADSWRVAPLLKERKIPVIIGGTHRLPMRRDDDYDIAFRLPAALQKAGVTFALSRGERDSSNERNLPFEAGTAVAHGLPRDEAVKAITLYPAQILGVADKVGSLEVGKLGSFFVADGDPLEVRTKVERVFVQGREIPVTNRQTQLNDKYEQRYKRVR
jgi:imidazolonepropionase-like amidohydrolase